MSEEICEECGAYTGNAGEDEDSLFVYYPDKPKIGPLCQECRDLHWVCDKCGEGVYSGWVTYNEKHDGCGGDVS